MSSIERGKVVERDNNQTQKTSSQRSCHDQSPRHEPRPGKVRGWGVGGGGGGGI